MTQEEKKEIRCYSCQYEIKDLRLGDLHIECMIKRKGQDMTSTFYTCEKHDQYGHREYIKKCPYYKKGDEFKPKQTQEEEAV